MGDDGCHVSSYLLNSFGGRKAHIFVCFHGFVGGCVQDFGALRGLKGKRDNVIYI